MHAGAADKPPAAVGTPTWVEQRLTDLEIKASYTDDLLEQLNQLVYRQQQQIDALAQRVNELQRQAPEAGAPRHLRDELPPHY